MEFEILKWAGAESACEVGEFVATDAAVADAHGAGVEAERGKETGKADWRERS